jgi:hypothetical protein
MNQKRGVALARSSSQAILSLAERCMCQPLSSLHPVSSAEQEEDEMTWGHLVPAAQALNNKLRTLLHSLFPRSTPLSLLLLHVSQLEYTHGVPQVITQMRRCYHASSELLEQILVNVRRAIRREDTILVHEGTGAVILFPDVDQHGASVILERVYRNITLLQAETIIPPLRHETTILLGIGTYPEPGASLEQLLYHTERVAQHLTLRPAITTHYWTLSLEPKPEISLSRHSESEDSMLHKRGDTSIPFMQLPAEIPLRLKQLIPYDLALALRCIPVGRNHHCLTVAMANPTNREDIRRLQMATHMTIFPVSCEEDALNTLLEQKW